MKKPNKDSDVWSVAMLDDDVDESVSHDYYYIH